MRIIALLILVIPSWSENVFGRWTVTSSTGGSSAIVSIRIEPHPKGEVFTVDRVDLAGPATTDSTILYVDAKPRQYLGTTCSGTQSSRRVDIQTVEIIRKCDTGGWTRLVRRSLIPKKLTLDITEQRADGHPLERRLIMKRQ